MNKFYLQIVFFVFILSGIKHSYAIHLSEKFQVHGFLTQGAFYTTDNNYNGESENKVSFDQTEIGLNALWQVAKKVSFSAQGLFRRAGKTDNGSIRLDYALINIDLFNSLQSQLGIRLGRVKNPIGLYNETRDMAFTTPSILLPQSIYHDRIRSLYLSSDGGQFFADYQLGSGWLSIKANYGLPQNDNDELRTSILGPFAYGELNADKASIFTQVSYNIESNKYIVAVSYANIPLNYKAISEDIFSPGSIKFSPYVFSAQYNGDKISLTGEYYYSRNYFKDFGPFYPDLSSVTIGWYLQGAYRLSDKWQATLRYDVNQLNRDDPSGSFFENIGLPHHMTFTKDWMIGLRWDITPRMMLRGEYHKINGTSWLPNTDNPDRNQTQQYWEMFSLQFSYRF